MFLSNAGLRRGIPHGAMVAREDLKDDCYPVLSISV
jgi:hypothetical protein